MHVHDLKGSAMAFKITDASFIRYT